MEQQQSTEERIGRIEVAVTNLEREFTGIQTTLNAIGEKLNSSRETNWSLIISAVALLVMLWLAAIRPINADIERQQNDAKTLSSAVIKQNEVINDNKNALIQLRAQFDIQVDRINYIDENGSKAMDKRVALLEYKLKDLK